MSGCEVYSIGLSLVDLGRTRAGFLGGREEARLAIESENIRKPRSGNCRDVRAHQGRPVLVHFATAALGVIALEVGERRG